jgi:hypothetical protein
LKFLIILLTFFLPISINAQRYFTKSGKIDFDATSTGSPERVEGITRTATCVIDTKTGAIQFSVLIKGFEFERALMEEHFNENYLESNKYPKSEFRGTITDNSTVNYNKDGSYTVNVKGQLTIHGVTKEVSTPGKLTVQNGKLIAEASFSVLLSDYNISIPGLVSDKVSKTAKISIACQLELFKN